MRKKNFLTRFRIKIGVTVAALIVIAVFGVVVAKTVTRPMDIELRTHIKICKKSEKGGWDIIDEVGPANLRFSANLLEMASGRKIGSDFVWNAKSKKGKPYSVRLVEPARTNLHATGKFDVELMFEINYDGEKARVPGKLTTESLTGPLGAFRGQRAKGMLGHKRTTMKLVSVNKFQSSPKSEPLMLVCIEEYKLTPKNSKR